MRRSPRLGEFPHAASPAVQAEQGDADRLVAERLEPGQAEGLDRGPPVNIDGAVVVEQAGEGAGDELAEGVAEQPGLVEEMPPRLVAALGDKIIGGIIEQLPQLRDRDLPHPAVAVPIAGQLLECGLDDDLVGGPERNPVFPDPLAADQPAHQREPAAENDRRPALRLFCVELIPAVGRAGRTTAD